MKSNNVNESKTNAAHSILIVDDMAKNIQLVAKFLTDEGYNLFFAQSGEIALKQINSKSFDLILLDVMMPMIDGFEVCRKIKENQKTSSIPIIFLTAKSDEDAIAKGFALGGVDYITKPFNPMELKARVKTHLNLRQREKELDDLNNTKDTLLTVISHDLKTPFFNIMGLGELLLNGYNEYDDAMKKELISNMVESSRISHNLLENLLSWIRIQTGKIKYSPQPVALHIQVKEVLELLESQLMNKEVSFSFDIPEKIVVMADVNMLQTIIRNLLTNAIKYSPRAGKVKIEASILETNAMVKVIDYGTGISEERLETLFQPSSISSIPGTENEQGTGFGLILIKEFIEQHSGKIFVESTPGKSTTFSFTVPLATSVRSAS